MTSAQWLWRENRCGKKIQRRSESNGEKKKIKYGGENIGMAKIISMAAASRGEENGESGGVSI